MEYHVPCHRLDHTAGALSHVRMPWSGTLLAALEPVAVRLEHRGGVAAWLPAGTVVEDAGRSWDPLLDWATDHLVIRSGALAGQCAVTREWPANDDELPPGFAPAPGATDEPTPAARWAGVAAIDLAPRRLAEDRRPADRGPIGLEAAVAAR